MRERAAELAKWLRAMARGSLSAVGRANFLDAADLLSSLPPVRGEQETEDVGPLCVCGHYRDEHGGDGAGHCGATKKCRSNEGCRAFTPAPAPVRAEAAKTEQRSIVLCPQCQRDMPRERHDRGLFPASMAEWCDRCLPAFSPLFGKSAASPVREAEPLKTEPLKALDRYEIGWDDYRQEVYIENVRTRETRSIADGEQFVLSAALEGAAEQ